MALIGVRRELSPRARRVLVLMSFLVPLGIWSAVSYVPFLWHPKVAIESPGDLDYAVEGMLIDVSTFEEESARLREEGLTPPSGTRANPIIARSTPELKLDKRGCLLMQYLSKGEM